MQTLTTTQTTYCGIPVGNEYDKIPQVFFTEIENYFTKGYCCGFMENLLQNNFVMAVASADMQFNGEGVYRQIMFFMLNRIPSFALHWGSNSLFTKYVANPDKYFTREELIDRFNLG